MDDIPDGEYIYFARRPLDIGTIPTEADNPPCKIVCFDHRLPVNQNGFMAWGSAHYHEPLSDEQIKHYELRPSLNNPDVRRQMSEQAQQLGVWEERNHIKDDLRLTSRKSRDEPFSVKYGISQAQLAEQYDFSVRVPSLAARRQQKAVTHRPIAR